MAKPNFTLPNKPAIKSGSILSYNYTDDFTFVPAPLTFNRDSAATRVNEKGLIEDVGYFGPELVQNGDFEQIGSELTSPVNFLGDWFTTGATSITENTFQASGSGIGVYFSLTINKIYKVKVSNVSGDISIRYRTSNGGAGTVAGNFDEFIYVNTYNSTTPNIYLRASSETTATVGNVSVKEVGQSWTFETGWSMGDNKAVYDGVAIPLLQSDYSMTGSKKYRTTIQVVDTSGNGNCRFAIKEDNNTAISFTTYAEGTITLEFTSPTTGLFGIQASSSEGSFDITNISVIEVLGDKPRIDYSDSLTEPSLLLEPQSTNLITYSEDFSQWILGSNSTLTYVSDVVAPDGSLGVYRLQNPQTGSTFLSVGFKNCRNFSLFVKAVTEGVNNQFNLDASGQPTDTKTATTKWQRFDRDFGTQANYNLSINNGIDNYASDIYIWGAQAEALSYATSYIPTAGSTATRLGETANNAGDVNVFNSEEGVLYVEIAALENGGTFRALGLSDNTNSNVVNLLYRSGAGQMWMQVRSAGAETNILIYNVDHTQNNKIAIKYKKNNFAIWVNGVEKGTNNSGLTPVLLNTFKFRRGDGLEIFYGKVRNVQVFNKALTDRELEILTIQ